MRLVDSNEDNCIYISAGDKQHVSSTSANTEQNDVYTHLYRDARRKSQLQVEAESPRVNVYPESLLLSRGIQIILPGRTNAVLQTESGIRRGSSEVTILPGITAFETSRRIDALALPRGDNNTVVYPPPPNYGRLLNFTEEEASSKRRHSLSRPCPRPRACGVTRPTCNPRINRLATPKKTQVELMPTPSQRNGAREQRRPVNPVGSFSSRIFRF